MPRLVSACLWLMACLSSRDAQAQRASQDAGVALAPRSAWDALYARRRFFELRDSAARPFPAGSMWNNYYAGLLAYAFNRNERATELLLAFVNVERGRGVHTRTALEALSACYRREGAYSAANAIDRRLVTEFGPTADSGKAAGYLHDARFSSALRDVPGQRVEWSPGIDSVVAAERRYEIRIAINGRALDSTLLFDTGANYTLIDRSTAAASGAAILDSTIDVETITGQSRDAHIAVLDRLAIGGLTIRNVIALVMDDRDMDIPAAHFHLTGLIGLPVIAAVGRATLTASGRIVLRKPTTVFESKHANLALDRFEPLVAVRSGAASLVMSLDTGAGETLLYPGFRLHTPSSSRGDTSTSAAVAGVGNVAHVDVTTVRRVDLRIDGVAAVMSEVRALVTPSNAASAYLDGNLGRDVLKKMGNVTIDFGSMRLVGR